MFFEFLSHPVYSICHHSTSGNMFFRFLELDPLWLLLVSASTSRTLKEKTRHFHRGGTGVPLLPDFAGLHVYMQSSLRQTGSSNRNGLNAAECTFDRSH